MPSYNHIFGLCGSPQHSPLECPLKFEYPEFMQEYKYKMSMHRTMVAQTSPQEQSDECLISMLQEEVVWIQGMTCIIITFLVKLLVVILMRVRVIIPRAPCIFLVKYLVFGNMS
jgi:hypothetical protein